MSVPPPAPENSLPPNRLINATSPYLLQHAHNPVDWYEWGPEALERAKADDRPIFLSIGYSACHWCHVMAHESFENPAIAERMNDYFVNIKVDREERPDLDEIYMRATLAYTRGHGGWPMSVWLTPDLQPFAAGTYFPPEQRYGRPGFPQICEAVHDAWLQKRGEIEKSAAALSDYLASSMGSPQGEGAALTLDHVDKAAELLSRAFDDQFGGIASGGTNKFPPSMALELMLRSAWRHRADNERHTALLDTITTTLDHMALGGIRDHLAGGFARYSTDVEWHVPHFEKMLYDQALVSRIYLDAYQATGRNAYAAVAREILDYVADDLRSPDGAFYSARDADSEGEEGKYYVWKHAEVMGLLGPDDGPIFCAVYDVRPGGNWQDPHAPGEAKNVLRIVAGLETVAAQFRRAPAEIEAVLARSRAKLLAARAQRIPPALDDKILCEWNGLMIASFARAAAVLDEPRYADIAAGAARYLLAHQCHANRLARSSRNGKQQPQAFLSDYAALIEGLVELHQTTLEPEWLARAQALNGTALQHFWDCKAGGFYFTADDHERILTRTMEVADNAVPSGNSIQLMNLLRLGTLLGNGALHGKADRMITTFGPTLLENAGSGERFLCGVDYAVGQPLEVAVIGPRDDERTAALLRAARERYLPNHVLVWRDPQRPADVESPLLANRGPIDDQPTAYVCRGSVCLEPATSAQQLAEQLGP